ncbi:uncharacterized protein zgc:113263 isoform X2 [Puntigrus tetrazona]|uniref:uncharacterized protein zgc:113263 isoform X2 n=1 Tax=Puntigrus tetrazona TaxID=1606681 RepID=UPI001C8A996A|nr:uncharacterized protein zgc:113263 isoform X2 [Puntigrus tetrazona]
MEALWSKKIEDPLSLMSFIIPPSRLLSAAMWQVTEQRQVKHYGMLEEFVTMVTESVPELLNYNQRTQLIFDLRARHLLELCRVKRQVNLEHIQMYLDRIRAPRVNEVVHEEMEESEACFLDLIQTLISNPEEREHFFQNIFPEEYGPKFDKNLKTRMEAFLLQFDRMMSVPDLSQTVSWFRTCPSLLDECLRSVFVPKQMKTLLEHHRANKSLQDNESLHSAHNGCTFSSQSLPPLVRVVISSDHTESGDLSESGADVDGQDKDDCHTSKTLSDPDTSCWTTKKRKFKVETEERENEEEEDDDKNWPITGARYREKLDSFFGEELNQTHTKKISKKSSKKKRDDSTDVSGEFTFINHLGAYTEESSYQTSDASKVPWSEEETFSLIDIWGKDSVQRSLKDCARNRHIFNLISKKMFERGFTRTAEQCHTRIKRLKMSFRQCHENIMKGEKPEWKFYNVLEKILCQKESTEQEDTLTDVSIPEESTGQPAEDDTEWDVLGHVGLEGTRNIPWTDQETQTLIRIWGEDKTQRELRGVLQNGHIFAMISKKMATHGYIRTAEQCQSRVKRLKLCFKQSYESKHIEGKEPVEFKFYKQMERIMANEEPCSSQIKEEESTDIEYQVYKYQEIETAMNCIDDRKKVAWSDAETLILLQLWGNEQVQQNLQRCPHNGHIYSEISEKLNAHGYLRSAEQCHTRIKRLKISYRQCRDSMSSPAAERVEFKFYDLMEDIFQRNASSKGSGDNESSKGIKLESQDTCNSVDQTTSWSDSETTALIDIWAENEMQEALRGTVHNIHVFTDIAEKLNNQGFFKTPEQCRWKIKNLTKNFRQCYEWKKCGIEKVDCKFYDKLEHVLGDETFPTDVYDEDDQDAECQQAAMVAVSESGRKMTWSDRETQALLDIWGDDRVQHSLMSCPKNRHIYRYISKRMMALGFNRTGVQCHSRVKRLKSQFYYDGREECKFYDQLEQIILKDRTSEGQDISELESITDSDSDSLALSKPLTTDGPKLAWGDSETHTLISIWGSDTIQERLKGCVKRKPVFQQISVVMAEKGYSRTDEQCRSRIKRLKASYRQCLDNYRNEGEQVEWKFFKQLNKIFEKYPLDDAETTTAQEPEAVGRKNPNRSAKAQSSV